MSQNNSRTAVLLDPHPLWLDAVEQILNRNGFTVAGKATTTDEALQLVADNEPDMLVTEIELGSADGDGLACLRRARELVPTLRPIVVSRYDDPEHIEEALEAGAHAYVIKTAHRDDLASAIRQAFDPSVYLARGHSAPPPRAAAEEIDDSVGLTRRELEILQLVAEGHSNAQLGRMLWVTEQTVKFHLSNIYRKLDVSNRTEASRWAQVHGLLPASRSAGAA
jgi:DNA-binding NarL/FixJ family response regulator